MAIRKNADAASVRAKKSAPVVNGTDHNLSKLREIVKVLETSTLAELRYEDAEIAVEVRRYGSAAPQPVASHPVMTAPAAVEVRSATAAPAPAAANDANVTVVRSPFV